MFSGSSGAQVIYGSGTVEEMLRTTVTFIGVDGFDAGAVVQLGAAFFQVVDQVPAVRGADALHEVGRHFQDGDLFAIFRGQPVRNLAAYGATGDHRPHRGRL